MTRRCSHCSNNGHNSRTCPARGRSVRLFGVRLTEGVGAMKKSASMGCLPSSSASSMSPSNSTSASAAPASPSSDPLVDARPRTLAAAAASGYASDDPARGSSSNCRGERKKGIPWTEDEHRMFLIGLQKLGKGDWRGIARNFVLSRTPTQVASHAQKFFIRQSNISLRKRRSSLFDMVPAPDEQLLPQSPDELEVNHHLPTSHGGQQEPEPAESSRTESVRFKDPITAMVPTINPTFVIAAMSSWPWPPNSAASSSIGADAMAEPKELPRKISMSKLSIADGGRMETTDLSLELMGSSSPRQSAFQTNTSIAVPDLNKNNKSPIHAI
ncbi:transcription factor MYBS3-like [Curcuma longa]|uniref:transcription factor MYBS3-like n=1 Tax=Curcuma longa TaxID=136217 RepID=UPI003D9E076E